MVCLACDLYSFVSFFSVQVLREFRFGVSGLMALRLRSRDRWGLQDWAVL